MPLRKLSTVGAYPVVCAAPRVCGRTELADRPDHAISIVSSHTRSCESSGFRRWKESGVLFLDLFRLASYHIVSSRMGGGCGGS